MHPAIMQNKYKIEKINRSGSREGVKQVMPLVWCQESLPQSMARFQRMEKYFGGGDQELMRTPSREAMVGEET